MKSYDLTFAAEGDLRSIWDYTSGRWGLDQADTYLAQIETCCETVGGGSVREKANDRPVVIAILHERMDLVKRLKNRL